MKHEGRQSVSETEDKDARGTAAETRVEDLAPYVATMEYECGGRRLRRTFRAPTAAAAIDGLVRLMNFGTGT